MFCEKCGKPIPEGMTECPDCSLAQAPAEEAVQVAGETDVLASEQVVYEEQYYQEPVYEEPSFEEPVVVKKKKSKKGLAIGGIITAAIAVTLAVIIAFFPGVVTAVKGFFLKTFGSDESYYAFVQEKTAAQYTEIVTNAYDSILEMLTS